MTSFLDKKMFGLFCCLVAFSGAMLVHGCARTPDEEMLLEAWQRCEALEYEAAFPLIRTYLLSHPRNPVAHYLLGKYYQQRETPALTLAKGQFDTARYFFEAEGELSVLADMMSPSEFQATLHCDTALVLLRTVIEAEESGMPQRASLPVLRSARDHARKGVYFNPTSFFIQDLARTLEDMLAIMAPAEKPEVPAVPVLPPPGRWTT